MTGVRHIWRAGCVSAGSGLLLVVGVATRSGTCWSAPRRRAIPLRSRPSGPRCTTRQMPSEQRHLEDDLGYLQIDVHPSTTLVRINRINQWIPARRRGDQRIFADGRPGFSPGPVSRLGRFRARAGFAPGPVSRPGRRFAPAPGPGHGAWLTALTSCRLAGTRRSPLVFRHDCRRTGAARHDSRDANPG